MSEKPATRRLTQPDMILISFHRASGGTTNKVPYEELVIQAWRDYPEAFSLRNHPEHPESSDVHKKLYSGPLKNDGLVISLGNKVFRLTDKGLARAEELKAASESVKPATLQDRSRLSRSEENFMKHALSSRTFATWHSGEREKLVDYDARVFFQFSTSTPIEERKRKAAFAREAIEKARHTGVESAQDLGKLAEYLVLKFGQLLMEA